MVAHEFAMNDYFATDCGHCQHFAPVWDKAASNSHADAVWTKVECSGPGWSAGKDSPECEARDIHSYPTVKLLHYDNNGKIDKFWDYEGPRTPEALEAFATSNIDAYRNGDIATRCIQNVGILPFARQAILSSFL